MSIGKNKKVFKIGAPYTPKKKTVREKVVPVYNRAVDVLVAKGFFPKSALRQKIKKV